MTKCAGDGMCIDPRCPVHSPPEMRALCGEPVPLTRAKLDDLLDAFADAYGTAVLAANGGRGYQEATEKAVEAKQAILKAVFP